MLLLYPSFAVNIVRKYSLLTETHITDVFARGNSWP